MTEKGGQEDVSLQMDRLWRPVFDKYDCNGDGEIPLDDFRAMVKAGNQALQEDLPDEVLDELLDRSDWDKSRSISFEEFLHMIKSREMAAEQPRLQKLIQYAAIAVVPKCERRTVVRLYNDEYNCRPPPIFLASLTVAIIGVYMYYAIKLDSISAVPFESPLIYNPYRRKEAWRYITYLFIHAGFFHMFFNVIMQLVIGIPLEMVHKWWRVGLVYIAGVITGSLAASLSDPTTYLAGASGGVYALLAAHMANVLINLKEMEFGIVRFVFLLLFAGTDIGVAVYERYTGDSTNKTSYSAHIGGSLAGLLVGLILLRNLKVRRFEVVMGAIALSIFFFAAVFVIIWNIAYTDYYPEQEL